MAISETTDRRTDRQTATQLPLRLRRDVSHLPVRNRCLRWSCAGRAMSCRTVETLRRKGHWQRRAHPTACCRTYSTPHADTHHFTLACRM